MKLSILAARGELNQTCPPDMIHVLNALKMHGVDIEVTKDFYLMMSNYATQNKNDDLFNKYRELYLTLFDPAYKNERERFMKEAQEKLAAMPEEIQVKTQKGSTIKGEYNLNR